MLTLLASAQAIAGCRVAWRLARTARGATIRRSDAPVGAASVSVVVPVLNEERRLGPCLHGLIAQSAEVGEILVVDGGSCDGTRALVEEYRRADQRIRFVDASPVPPDWNGKAYGLQVGLEFARRSAAWLLTIDADVRPSAALTRSLVAHAEREGAPVLSVATKQVLSGVSEGLVHPALLTTLVYRFGIPGQKTRNASRVQANEQCCLFRRDALDQIDGFRVARRSVCEDVTVARALAASGHAVGFYEPDVDVIVSVEMYEGWHDAWRNWTRSLPMRDQFSGVKGWVGLAEVVLVQAAPLPLAALLAATGRRGQPAWVVNCALSIMRLGVLQGTARAYARRPWTYWLSPLVDLPAALQLLRSAARRRHTWRGRTLVRGTQP